MINGLIIELLSETKEIDGAKRWISMVRGERENSCALQRPFERRE